MEKMRENYLKLVVQTLKENVKKTSTMDLDDMVMAHFGMCVEERCFEKNRNLASYTKAITAARLNIERYTSAKKLFPMIADSVQAKESEMVATTECNNGEFISSYFYFGVWRYLVLICTNLWFVPFLFFFALTAEKRTIQTDDCNDGKPVKRSKYTEENDIIIIDSSDSEDEQYSKDYHLMNENIKNELSESIINFDNQFNNNNNNENIDPKREILISVQTTSINNTTFKKKCLTGMSLFRQEE